jgi:hypothetical protein
MVVSFHLPAACAMPSAENFLGRAAPLPASTATRVSPIRIGGTPAAASESARK